MKRQRVLPIILQGTVFRNKELAEQNIGSAEVEQPWLGVTLGFNYNTEMLL